MFDPRKPDYTTKCTLFNTTNVKSPCESRGLTYQPKLVSPDWYLIEAASILNLMDSIPAIKLLIWEVIEKSGLYMSQLQHFPAKCPPHCPPTKSAV